MVSQSNIVGLFSMLEPPPTLCIYLNTPSQLPLFINNTLDLIITSHSEYLRWQDFIDFFWLIVIWTLNDLERHLCLNDKISWLLLLLLHIFSMISKYNKVLPVWRSFTMVICFFFSLSKEVYYVLTVECALFCGHEQLKTKSECLAIILSLKSRLMIRFPGWKMLQKGCSLCILGEK